MLSTFLVGRCWEVLVSKVLVHLHPAASGKIAWFYAVRGDTSRSNRVKSDPVSFILWGDVGITCGAIQHARQEDAPKTQIHVSTHPSVQDAAIKKLEILKIWHTSYF